LRELLLGLFGGAGATFVWELLLKPLREGRSVAEVLSAEVSINIQLLAAAKLHASVTKIPPDFELSTMVFDAVASGIGGLSSQTVSEVIFLYRYFKQLNELPKTYVQFVNDLRAAGTGSVHREAIENEIRTLVDVFNGYIEKAIVRVNIAQPMLLAAAFPWWSFRSHGRPKSKELELGELAGRVIMSQAERARLAEEIRRRQT
jgi:hypothetical protein